MMWILCITAICIIGIICFAQYKFNQYNKYVKTQNEMINNVISIMKTRNVALNQALLEYITWINNDFNKESIELFIKDQYLLALKQKYKINDTEYVLAFQNVISEIQNLSRARTQELINIVVTTVVNTVKEQMGEK